MNENIRSLENQIDDLLNDDYFEGNEIRREDKILFMQAKSYWNELADLGLERVMKTENKKKGIVKALNDRSSGLGPTIHRVHHVAAEIAEMKLRPVEKLMEELSIRLCGWAKEMTAFLNVEDRSKWINKAFAEGRYPVGDFTWEKELDFNFDYTYY